MLLTLSLIREALEVHTIQSVMDGCRWPAARAGTVGKVSLTAAAKLFRPGVGGVPAAILGLGYITPYQGYEGYEQYGVSEWYLTSATGIMTMYENWTNTSWGGQPLGLTDEQRGAGFARGGGSIGRNRLNVKWNRCCGRLGCNGTRRRGCGPQRIHR